MQADDAPALRGNVRLIQRARRDGHCDISELERLVVDGLVAARFELRQGEAFRNRLDVLGCPQRSLRHECDSLDPLLSSGQADGRRHAPHAIDCEVGLDTEADQGQTCRSDI